MEVVNAESTPATVPVEQLNSDQRAEWLKSGDLPKVETKTEESSTSDAPKVEGSESAPGSETGKPSAEAAAGEKPKNAETRIRELVARQREAEERAVKAERELADLKAGKKPDEKTTEAASSPAKPESGLKEPEKPKRPKLEEFATFEEYEAALDKHDDAHGKWEAEMVDYRLAVKEAEAKAKADADAAAKAEETATSAFRTKVAKAIERHPDYKEKLESAAHLHNIREGSLIDTAIRSRELGAEMVYHFACHPDALAAIQAMDAIDQGAELKKLESQLSKAGTSAPPKVSSAPGPLSEVGGKGATPEDEVQAALKADDFRAYKRAADAKDVAKRKS